MTGIITSNPTLYDLWRWHPVVLPGKDETHIATALIEASINQMKVAGVQSLEVCFDFNDNRLKLESEAYFQKYKNWYEICGAVKLDEYVYMTLNNPGFNTSPNSSLQNGLEIKSLKNHNKNQVYDCFYQAFLNGEDRSFLGRTQAQRREMFEEYFGDSEKLNEEASLILLQDDQVIGFSIFQTRPYINDEHMALLCIHPDHQGKSLGKQLLSHSLSKVVPQKNRPVSLGVDVDNVAAFKLYQKLGFETQSKFITYVFKNEDLA
jgi:ribosomal protein S18 acetylase RimI-like enzyme